MFHRLARRNRLSLAALLAAGFFVALCLCVPPVLRAQSDKDAPKDAKPSDTAELRIELTGGDKKVPIADASVYLKFTEDKLIRDKRIELDLKTNQKGVARSPDIPKGRVLIQIVSPGWKTFGQYYEINQDEQVIQINLKRPTANWLRP
jgi:hypothetical protein